MAECIDYNCNDPLGSHLEVDCGAYLLAGVNGLVVIDCGVTVVDPSDGVEIAALIAAGTATLVNNIKTGVDASTPVTVDSPTACGVPIRVTDDRTATLFDANVNSNNVTFYDTWKGISVGSIIANICGTAEDTPKVWFIDSEIRLVGNFITPNVNTEFIRFEGTFTWRSKNEPTLHDQPANIF